MEIKHFNRKPLFRVLYVLIIVLIAASTALLIYTFLIENWSAVGGSLILFSIGMMALLGILDKNHDIIIDYTNKEVRSNLKFGKKESYCIPFESIVSIYIYRADQLKKEVQLKKYPAQTLVIEKRNDKAYIPLKFFDEETIRALMEELQKAREAV
ncbi:MAG: hypothetical protein IKW18_05570 [Clostridia bacterium]|nr:hypothetical protein [Clostridia bacterium]